MDYLFFREMINHSHTEAEVKEIAAEFEMVDEDPGEEGEDVIRACKPRDRIPAYVIVINCL